MQTRPTAGFCILAVVLSLAWVVDVASFGASKCNRLRAAAQTRSSSPSSATEPSSSSTRATHAADPCGQSGLEWGTYTWRRCDRRVHYSPRQRHGARGLRRGTPGRTTSCVEHAYGPRTASTGLAGQRHPGWRRVGRGFALERALRIRASTSGVRRRGRLARGVAAIVPPARRCAQRQGSRRCGLRVRASPAARQQRQAKPCDGANEARCEIWSLAWTAAAIALIGVDRWLEPVLTT